MLKNVQAAKKFVKQRAKLRVKSYPERTGLFVTPEANINIRRFPAGIRDINFLFRDVN